jgi:excisionase family DNA binding protein
MREEVQQAGVRHLTAEEDARRFGVRPWAIYQLARKGTLRSIRIGRRVRFRLQDIERFEEAGGTSGERAQTPQGG